MDKTTATGNTVLHYAVLLEDDERMCVSLLNLAGHDPTLNTELKT